MARFLESEIISLVGAAPLYDLGESLGPDLRVGETDKGVRVANGAWFGDEQRVFRLGFGLLAMSDLQVALRLVADTLRQTSRAAA